MYNVISLSRQCQPIYRLRVMCVHIDHIGYAVTDIEKASDIFNWLGYEPCGDVIDDFDRRVSIRFFKNGETLIECIAPLGNDSPVCKWLEKNGCSPYHLCYISDNIEHDIELLKSSKFKVISLPSPAKAFGGKRVAFLYNQHVGLIELVER